MIETSNLALFLSYYALLAVEIFFLFKGSLRNGKSLLKLKSFKSSTAADDYLDNVPDSIIVDEL